MLKVFFGDAIILWRTCALWKDNKWIRWISVLFFVAITGTSTSDRALIAFDGDYLQVSSWPTLRH